jgi:glucosamine--fructose-6-phosphate aminotransferase (isomerizing)
MSKMLDEIREQPAALERTLGSALRQALALRKRLEGRPPRLVVLAARGTSDNAAQFGRYLIEVTLGVPVSLAAPSVFTLYRAALDLKDALVAGISQSGESTDTNSFLEHARRRGALTVGITNEARSAMARLVDFPLVVRAGRERSVAATKTYTGQILALYLLVHALGGRVRLEALRCLPAAASEALRLEARVAELAERYRYMERAVVVGRGFQYGNTLEFGLKLMETCQVVADRFSGADLLHGPIAMVSPSFPVFLFAPPGPTAASTRIILEGLKRRRAETVVFTARGGAPARAADFAVTVPDGRLAAEGEPEDLYTPIPFIVPAQLFAAWLAAHKRLDPDAPPGLRKVTKTM